MAIIERNPNVKDYILSLSINDIKARNGAEDLIEEGHIIVINDLKIDFDFEALPNLSKSLEGIEDLNVKRSIKKLLTTKFFEGEEPTRSHGRLLFSDSIRQVIFDHLCKGDELIYNRAAKALKSAHEQILGVFDIAFPNYDPFRFIPSLRITRTLFENLHWDNHSIDDDFHQARIFANLDSRPRIWHVSHLFPDFMDMYYETYELSRFAGRDPNEMLNFLHADILGGLSETWRENLPKHKIAFAPGDIWLGESRMVSHQIYYGESAMVYMWFVHVKSMADSNNRFNVRVEELHRRMSEKINAA